MGANQGLFLTFHYGQKQEIKVCFSFSYSNKFCPFYSFSLRQWHFHHRSTSRHPQSSLVPHTSKQVQMDTLFSFIFHFAVYVCMLLPAGQGHFLILVSVE